MAAHALDRPTATGERLVSLDVLRGLAVLGILAVNIQAFAMPFEAYLNPALGGLAGADFWFWLAIHVPFELKFIALFALLFGAGLALTSERWAAAGAPEWWRHGRRMAGLAVIGLAHAYLLWYGDILFIYAVAGVIAFVFRHVRLRYLLATAAVFYLLPLPVSAGMNEVWSAMPAEKIPAELSHAWTPPESELAAQREAYQGSWLHQMGERASNAFQIHASLPISGLFWRTLAWMLVGIAAYRSGFLTLQWRARNYALLALAGAPIGVAIVLAGVAYNQANDWAYLPGLFLGREPNALGAPFIVAAWTGVTLALLQLTRAGAIRHAFAALGRVALTAYLLQTVICTTIFYGHGLGLFGQVGRGGQWAIVIAIWMVLLILAQLWLKRFRMGPIEWLWRWATYGKRPAFRA